jgi:hypothetical protein
VGFTLYELTGRWLDLLHNEDLDPEVLQDTLDAIDEEIDLKAENTAKLIKSWEAQALAIKQEEDRLNQRRKALENKAERTKNYLQQHFELIRKDKVKTPLFTVALQNNPPSLGVLKEGQIPRKYKIKQPDKIDRKMILDDLKAGIKVRGASIAPTSRHLRIR